MKRVLLFLCLTQSLFSQNGFVTFEPQVAYYFVPTDIPVNQYIHHYNPGPGLNLRAIFYKTNRVSVSFVTGYKFFSQKEIKETLLVYPNGDMHYIYSKKGFLGEIPLLVEGRLLFGSNSIKPFIGMAVGSNRVSMTIKSRQYKTNTYELATSIDGSDAAYLKVATINFGVLGYLGRKFNIFALLNADYTIWDKAQFTYKIKYHNGFGGPWLGYDATHPTYEINKRQLDIYLTTGFGYTF